MKEITREDLLKAGFTEKEIVRLDDAILRGGGEAGDYGSSIKDLRKIFTSGAWSFVFFIGRIYNCSYALQRGLDWHICFIWICFLSFLLYHSC